LVTVDMPGASVDEIKAAIDTLAAEGDDHWVKRRASALMRIHRPREALELLERYDTWIGWSDANDLAQALGDPSC
jgi:hypothetical protein